MSATSRSLQPVRRFVRTPKGLLTVVLAILTVVAAPVEGMRLVAPMLVAATGTAMATDAVIMRVGDGAWTFPDGGMLTGWIVALILSPHERWWVGVATSAIAIIAKHAVRGKSANVFNPAAIGLVAVYYLFDAAQSWWGALSDAPLAMVAVLVATGAFIADRVNKVPVVIAFLGVYFALATAGAYTGAADTVAELYRAPDLHAALFFAFFMVTDPPTSPPRHRDQLVYGAITAGCAYAVFRGLGAVHFLLSGLLVANVWEAWRRRAQRRARQAARGSVGQPEIAEA
ncbi:MAG TPA: RnfABCDGE type electron transport complex subunit D [Gemmatimonadaceae bacterium]|nr:RnfABCDGE type electron transport complex subunit D [Gemmatimonadaceae bacterium]